MNILIIYGIVSIVSISVLLYFIKNSNYGYEDENGFHEGIPLSYKDKCLKALDETIYKYENPFNNIGSLKEMFNTDTCALCNVYYHYNNYNNNTFEETCLGCPMCSETGIADCTSFNSYQKAASAYTKYLQESKESVEVSLEIRNELINTLSDRRDFLVMLKDTILDLPEERFTPAGWKYLELNHFL